MSNTDPVKKPRISLPVIVEGRYDKSTILSMFDGEIFVTNGFSVFNAKEKQALFRKIAGEKGVILLTDSDGGGRQIRAFLSGILPKEKIHQLYIPEIFGKEKRKDHVSKAGFLGVEGMNREILEKVLAPFLLNDEEDNSHSESNKIITKVDFYEDKLTGCPDAEARREKLALHFSLPHDMTANALLSALNLICGYDGYKAAVRELFREAEE